MRKKRKIKFIEKLGHKDDAISLQITKHEQYHRQVFDIF